MSDRTAWDDIEDLAAQIGHEVYFEPAVIPQPDLICEPRPFDYDSDVPTGPLSEDNAFEAQVCRVHNDEWWPCETFRERGGVTPQPPLNTNRFVMRPLNDEEPAAPSR